MSPRMVGDDPICVHAGGVLRGAHSRRRANPLPTSHRIRPLTVLDGDMLGWSD